MRTSARAVAILVASLLMTTSPLLAAEETWEQGRDSGHGGQKDECLLVPINCIPYDESLQERINRLNNEIAKGRDVYNADELSVLRAKLDRTHERLDRERTERLFNPGL